MFISKTEYKYLLGRVDRLEKIVQGLELEAYEVVWEKDEHKNEPIRYGMSSSTAVGYARFYGESVVSPSRLYSVKTILRILLGNLGYKLFTVTSKESLILEKDNARTKKG